jgi:hypothetical protein
MADGELGDLEGTSGGAHRGAQRADADVAARGADLEAR